MDYLAVLGRERKLALVELESVTGQPPVEFDGCALIAKPLDIDRLGGAIKLAKVISRDPWRGWDRYQPRLGTLGSTDGKLVFGLSCYGACTQSEVRQAAVKLKRHLRKSGSNSVRVVLPAPGKAALSAAQLKFNAVLAKGFELIVAISGQEAVTAATEAVQDIDWYSKRDYGRPRRDAKVGMLPPKLAQIMLNLAGGERILDPFCGTGVILAEAALSGKPAAGSDIEPKMIEATKHNLDWLRTRSGRLPDLQLAVADARTIKIQPGNTIVTEGYLGPPLSGPPSDEQLKKIRGDISGIYLEALSAWFGQLKAGSRLCLALPCWKVKGEWRTLGLIDRVTQIGYNLVRFESADSSQLIYGRPAQIVGRQILVLEK